MCLNLRLHYNFSSFPHFSPIHSLCFSQRGFSFKNCRVHKSRNVASKVHPSRNYLQGNLKKSYYFLAAMSSSESLTGSCLFRVGLCDCHVRDIKLLFPPAWLDEKWPAAEPVNFQHEEFMDKEQVSPNPHGVWSKAVKYKWE